MSAVLFFIAAIGALAGAVGVVVLRNPFYSVLALVSHLIALAALFLLLRAEFVAAAQVVVYAGAVMVLYVFVVAYIGGADQPLHRPGGALRVLGPLFGLAVAIELCIAMLGTALKGISGKGAPYVPGFGTPQHIGRLFLTTYLFPFEIASLLLLVAAIGAVVLARRRRGLDPTEEDRFVQTLRSSFTGTMAESTATRAGGGTTTAPHEQTEPVGANTESSATPAGAGSGTSEGGW
jgi:NADH:ubiquinone oxidoreductase subunit 6 (subunit J)